MPPKSTAAAPTSTWVVPTPATADGFTYAHGEFFAEASGQNRHRRATVHELKEHFASGSDKDHPAHWFEAQLIHYGLKPSKTKSVARMRLFDAVNAGQLKVPAAISSLESTLKKEWAKREREAKQKSKDNSGPGDQAGTTKGRAAKVAPAKTTSAKTTVVKKRTVVETTVVKTTVAKAATTKTKAAATKTARAKSTPAKTQNTSGTKRKANTAASQAAPSASKKVKTATPREAASSKASSSAKKSTSAKPKTATSASRSTRGGISQGTGRGASKSASSQSQSMATHPNRSHGTEANAPSSPTRPWPKQMARRSAPFAIRGRISPPETTSHPRHDDSYGYDDMYDDEDDDEDGYPSSYPRYNLDEGNYDEDDGYDDYPPRYPGNNHDEDDYDEDYGEDDYGGDDYDEEFGGLEPLEHINGRYKIRCPDVSDNWSNYGEDFRFVFTMSGSGLWVAFDLGIIEGVLYLEDLPSDSSYDKVPFTWRGQEANGPVIYGDENEGWIQFLGGGRIEGWIDFQNLEFKGHRLPGPATATPITAHTMQGRWDGYSEEEYDRQNRARWR